MKEERKRTKLCVQTSQANGRSVLSTLPVTVMIVPSGPVECLTSFFNFFDAGAVLVVIVDSSPGDVAPYLFEPEFTEVGGLRADGPDG